MQAIAPYFAEGTLGEVAAIGGTALGLGYGSTRLLGVAPSDFRAATRMPHSVTRSGKRLRYGSSSSRRSMSSARARETTAVTPTPGLHTVTKKSAYHHQLGRKPGKYAVRKSLLTPGVDPSTKDKEVKWERLIQVPWSEDETQINRRRGQLANVRGVKIRAWFTFNASRALVSPLQVRWAIINPKDNNGADLDSTNKYPAEFFISPDPATEQEEDFPNSSLVTTSSFDIMNRKINRRKYGVMKEGTFILGNSPALQAAQTSFSACAFKKVQCYIPVNKQMKWANNASAEADKYPETNLYFVYWFCNLGSGPANHVYSSATTPLFAHYEFQTYFTNSKMFA